VTAVLVWLGVAVLGGLAAVARFLLDAAVASRSGSTFPAGTFVVNLMGSALLGLLAGLGVAGDALLLAGTAALGAFTTFSTWMFETQRLAEDGQDRMAAANVVLSVGAGLAAVTLGRWIGGI
jgi:CrcB protein